MNEPFLSLGNTPLSNDYLTPEQMEKAEIYYPLEAYFCDQCFLVQIAEYESPANIFTENYAYFSSYSDSWLQHSRKYAEMIIERLGLTGNSLVLEIGSNDGYLLQYFREREIPVLGVDPALNTVQAAVKKGIPTEAAFFNAAFAEALAAKGRKADLIIGNNVLAHNPNLNDFVAGLKIALQRGGAITMEFPHLLRLIEGNEFDTIYHEHYSYLSLHAVSRLFETHGLELFDVEELPTHGGSLRIYVKHRDDRKAISLRVSALFQKEEQAGLLQNGTYQRFAERVKSTKRSLLELLIGIKNKGHRIVGYGAPAKGNTLLNYCGIRSDILDYTVDRNPFKQQKFLPGTRILIREPSFIRLDRPDYVFVLPWNIREEIMAELGFIRKWLGKFIIPLPQPVVI